MPGMRLDGTRRGQEGTGGRFELATIVMPATIDHVRQISQAGERMPAKSTYFYPKLLSGLLLNPLRIDVPVRRLAGARSPLFGNAANQPQVSHGTKG